MADTQVKLQSQQRIASSFKYASSITRKMNYVNEEDTNLFHRHKTHPHTEGFGPRSRGHLTCPGQWVPIQDDFAP